MTARIDKCKAFLLDIFFPNRCPFCGGFIRWDEYICGGCSDKLLYANSMICRKCGHEDCICGSGINYDNAFASFFYNDESVGKAILSFKQSGDINIAEATAENLAACMRRENIPKPDIIVPVPMGKKKRRRRGHNQAELLARSIGKRLGAPVNVSILFKYDTDDEQHSHRRSERRTRVKGLFYTDGADLSGMTVLLCDDVMTTGFTINECAELLKALGAETLIAAVCAVTRLENTSEAGA